MAYLQRNALVPYTAQQMYNLVMDVTAYPEFLPGCRSTKILHLDDTVMRATVSLEKAGLQYSFTTENQLIKDETINIALIDGPFSRLQGGWQFQALSENACKISLELDFEFRGRMANMVFSHIFNQLANTFVDVFHKRAQQKHGK